MEHESLDDLGIFDPPEEFYFSAHPEHRWDSEKLGMDLDEVFTILPKQFNLMAIPILDRESFVLETKHVSYIAHDRAEFYELLRSRLEARRKEQLKMMLHTLSYLASDPRQMELPGREARHWGDAMHIARSKSFDCIVRFLAGFLRDEDPWADNATLAAGQNGHLTRQTDAASPTQNSGNVSSSPRTRKRSLTPATPSFADDDQDEDEIRPTKRMRFADDMVKPRAATPPRQPVSPRATRARKGQRTPVPQPPGSTVPPTPMAPSTSVGARPSADEASRGDPSERGESKWKLNAANITAIIDEF
ncbi:hypothetical protein F5883DRAFT_528874 [Diaporthe sp. PMI_573]|nr:hypothetical protein F5883DRAFT_528874 [Diaporthaceae sp. PMI_573]